MSGEFRIEPLGAQDRAAFSCGAAPLDAYLNQRASQDVKRLIASCFLAIEKSTGAVAGFYTLSACSVAVTELPTETLKRLPRYPVLPVALIGRLAVDLHFQGRGLAAALLADAATRVLDGDLKAFALIVDAMDEKAAAFYRHHGFARFVSRPMSLFLQLETVRNGR